MCHKDRKALGAQNIFPGIFLVERLSVEVLFHNAPVLFLCFSVFYQYIYFVYKQYNTFISAGESAGSVDSTPQKWRRKAITVRPKSRMS